MITHFTKTGNVYFLFLSFLHIDIFQKKDNNKRTV